ncbi:ATP-binding protein [Limnoraphis robusta]|uniref:histidine kinase n=1 Tax=Limnoraphis robusta CCNP1315 TaxID=3110306 RepID=A0ABU5TS68_9CYAN|nr:ATP-binding protein [Limnoraphis robusta]MEA5517709.1 ATP-binding protein [Limnoraphis robusta CCNP1315]MEA5546260.1 ATP-binding protein [Limnoraphis robusta CCNP1324]
MKPWKNSLLIQLVSSFLLLSLLIVSLVGFVAFYQAKISLKQSVFERLSATASLKEEELNRWVIDQGQTVLSLAKLPEIRTQAEAILTSNSPDSSSFLQEAFSSFITHQTGLQEIFLLSRSGRVVVSTHPKQIGLYKPLVQYSFVKPNSTEGFVSNFYRSPDTGKAQITLAIPLLNSDNKQQGILATNLNLDRIDQIIRQNTGLGKTGETYLVGNVGSSLSSRYVFISSKHLNSQEFSNGINSVAIQQAMQGKNGRGLYKNYQGISVIGVYYALPGQDLALIAEQTQTEAFAPARQLASSIFLSGLVLSSIMALGMLILGRRIVKPIKAIAKTAYLVSQGDLNQTAPVLSNNEIGMLAKTFNQMIEQLKLTYQKLADYSHTLEEKVEQRTQELRHKNQDLEITLKKLKKTQTQLVQQEKMASLGQLVAGVAHEINNPVNFIYGNVQPATKYARDLLNLIQLYQKHYPQPNSEIIDDIEAIDLAFIQEDFMQLLDSMKEGSERIKEIVLSLRNFSRLDESEQKQVDLHQGIESTLRILQNRLKAQSERPEIAVIKQYGQLPLLNCYPGQLNQVYMNLLSNAIDALEQDRTIINPHILIHTTLSNNNIEIRIADNGSGIKSELLERIFDPFFTTKPVGKGTGLGLSISYHIIVENHKGKLLCHSELGKGTEFIIKLPIRVR